MITSPSPKNAAHDAAQHDHSAVQHEGKPSERLMVGPRPLPLFLELVKMVAVRDPQTARNALEGLRKVQGLPPLKTRPDRAAL
ncbi:MAG: hypothetical protein KGJ05_07825, partial [Alphaproteobacteria bacterium]|nr:hypothetical protein [Alphaproteobacteria bacterium]